LCVTLLGVATSDRVYTFRADADFGPRLARVREAYERLAASGQASAVSRELALALQRELGERDEIGRDQSSLIRGTVEVFATAVEKVARDLELAEQYRCAEIESVGETGALLAAENWRD